MPERSLTELRREHSDLIAFVRDWVHFHTEEAPGMQPSIHAARESVFAERGRRLLKAVDAEV